ncbi:MAG: cytochrome d ubiquinol oxidase subunit II [Chloroflexi bacterium]|nr:cytochrome d ubiquinol oxidase subunit II [Chloroflexota bacterium]
MIDLNIVWFVLVAVLFIGFFFLEGFDYGVGIVLPFLGKDDTERRIIINTIGPHWDGNEVWLITAGGAMFAAFPEWYATMFSGFYLALFVMLIALILRGVAFEFRSKNEAPQWRAFWDWSIFGGSAVPALLWGVAIANLVRGLPIDESFTFTGNFFSLLSPFTLLAGVATLLVFTMHGAIFLTMKTEEDIAIRAQKLAGDIAFPTLGVVILLVVLAYFQTDVFQRLGVNPGVAAVGAAGALFAAALLIRRGQRGWAFVSTALTIALTVVATFQGLFPRVMVSSLNPDWSLTIYNASSSPYTLRIMTIVALIFVPIVLGYQAWSYWVFRQRVTRDTHLEY